MAKPDLVKVALADLVFKSVTHAVEEMPGVALDPAHEPLEDAIVKVIPITELELMVSVTVARKKRWFSVKVSEDRNI